MTADASVRPARTQDVPAIAAVQARAWRHAYAGLLSREIVDQLVPERLTGPWRTELHTEGHTVLVALSGDRVVGVAAIRPEQDAGELASLVVDPDRQREGHGSRLLSAAVDTLRDSGLDTLRTWSPERDEARLAFLTSAGLRPDGARRVLVDEHGTEIVEIRLHAGLVRSEDPDPTSR